MLSEEVWCCWFVFVCCGLGGGWTGRLIWVLILFASERLNSRKTEVSVVGVRVRATGGFGRVGLCMAVAGVGVLHVCCFGLACTVFGVFFGCGSCAIVCFRLGCGGVLFPGSTWLCSFRLRSASTVEKKTAQKRDLKS